MSARSCPSCGAELETPLACVACGALFSPRPEPTPFEAFGLAPGFDVDAAELKRRLLRFSRAMHPDYFGAAAGEARARAERNTAQLNAAYDVLADPARRADWLVRRLGGPSEREAREVDPAFLAEVLEWNETLDAARGSARGSPPPAEVERLAAALASEREARLARVARALTPLPSAQDGGLAAKLAAVRRELNELRYVDRALADVASLRVEHAASR